MYVLIKFGWLKTHNRTIKLDKTWTLKEKVRFVNKDQRTKNSFRAWEFANANQNNFCYMLNPIGESGYKAFVTVALKVRKRWKLCHKDTNTYIHTRIDISLKGNTLECFEEIKVWSNDNFCC